MYSLAFCVTVLAFRFGLFPVFWSHSDIFLRLLFSIFILFTNPSVPRFDDFLLITVPLCPNSTFGANHPIYIYTAIKKGIAGMVYRWNAIAAVRTWFQSFIHSVHLPPEY